MEVADRKTELTRFAPKDKLGLEIAPWHSSLAPKHEGFDVLILDVFDGPTLRERARVNPTIPDDAIIEDVDIVSSAESIGQVIADRELSGKLAYIIGSHVFEHLPNPLKFLQGCADALKPGGVLSLAFPDHRYCYDYFRSPTKLSEWIQGLIDDRDLTTPVQAYDQYERNATAPANDYMPSNASNVGLEFPQANIMLRYREWLAREASNDTTYHDVHCSVFTPSSFKLLICDAAYLGLCSFELIEVQGNGGEIIAHLRYRPDIATHLGETYLKQTRLELLQKSRDEEAASSVAFQQQLVEIEQLKAELTLKPMVQTPIDTSFTNIAEVVTKSVIAALDARDREDQSLRATELELRERSLEITHTREQELFEENITLKSINSELQLELDRLKTTVQEMLGSRTWRAGRTVAIPIRAARRYIGSD